MTMTQKQPTFQDRQRDAALQRVRDQQAADTRITDALHLMRGDRAQDVIHLNDDTAIVEVVTDKTGRVLYTVVHDDEPARVYTETLQFALLLAVQVMAGGRPQDDDYVYAARVLRAGGV